MIEKLLRRLFRYSTAGPALTRYYIFPRIKLHKIHASDVDFHTHPWNGISFILGWYYEERDSQPKKLKIFVNRVFAFTPHKVTIKSPVWTLFFHGNRINEKWNYGELVKPWEGSDQERSELVN